MYAIKIHSDHFSSIESALTGRLDVESVCFILCQVHHARDEVMLVSEEVVFLHPKDYEVRTVDRISVTPEKMLKVARIAQSRDLSIVMTHIHPGSNGVVSFSLADDTGDQHTFPFFHRVSKQFVHGALVFDSRCRAVSGRVFDKQGAMNTFNKIHVLGLGNAGLLKNCSVTSTDSGFIERKSRQEALLGTGGQDSLDNLIIAVIGAGGIGSSISSILAHASNCHLSIFDADIIESTNLSRIIGATPQDLITKTPKASIIKRYVDTLRGNQRSAANVCELTDENRDLLKCHDIVISTSDSALSRETLNRTCIEFGIPLLDLGVEFRIENGAVATDVGKVYLMEPGSACLVCGNQINHERLRNESLPEEQRDQLIEEGYIKGINGPEPSMMPYNMEVAARAAQIITGYFSGSIQVAPEEFEIFRFFSGKRHWIRAGKKKEQECPYCGASPR